MSSPLNLSPPSSSSSSMSPSSPRTRISTRICTLSAGVGTRTCIRDGARDEGLLPCRPAVLHDALRSRSPWPRAAREAGYGGYAGSSGSGIAHGVERRGVQVWIDSQASVRSLPRRTLR